MNASRRALTAALIVLRKPPQPLQSPCTHQASNTTTKNTPLLLAALAGLTASTWAYADLAAYAPPQSSPPSSSASSSSPASMSNWSPLAHEIAACSPLAVQKLTSLVSDASSHGVLVDTGVIHALAAALRRRTELAADDAKPLLVGLLNALADLSKREDTHATCVEAGIPLLLHELIREYPPVFGRPGGWWACLLAWAGLSPQKSKNEKPKIEGGPTSVDVGQVDLGAGIAYHTVRCLSNLAKNSSIHPKLHSTNVLRDLVAAITLGDPDDLESQNDEQLIDTLRSAVLAVAALSKSVQEDVVSLGGHKRLIAFMTQQIDTTAQTYAAGGVRNLARHPQTERPNWNVHRQLVVHGVADALISGMSAKATPQTQTFAVLAFADLMTTKHPKAHLIKSRLQPVYESYSLLMRSSNPSVSRAVYRTLGLLYGSEDLNTAVVVPEHLSTLIGEESGQFINGAVARGDVSALRAMRAMCNDQVAAQCIFDKGALEVLIRGAKKGKGEYWEECTSALSLLSQWPQIATFVASRGGLKAVIQRPCPNQHSRWAASLFANMARNDEYRAEIAHGGLNVILTALSSKDDAIRQQGARALYNLSLGGISKVLIRQGGSLVPLVKAASTSGETRRLAIGALAGISEAYEQPSQFIEADIVSVLLNAVKEDPTVTRDVAFCFCQMSQFTDVHGSLARSGAAAWLVDVISRNGGRVPNSTEAMLYATLAVCNIASSEGITRSVLRESGAIRILTAVSTSGMSPPLAIHAAKEALLNIRGKEKPSVMPIDGLERSTVPA